jgi:hypothetical protein
MRRRIATAGDILNEAAKGYDLPAIGRKCISGIRAFFWGGASQKVFSGTKEISILVAN